MDLDEEEYRATRRLTGADKALNMENISEDIIILEDFIKYFEAEAISRKYRRNISITVGEDDIQAIEEIIKAYKELEYKYNKALSDLVQAEHKNKELKKEKIKI